MNKASSNPELIKREGDFYVHYMKIVAFNGSEYPIDSQVIDFQYHEDIAKPGVYCSITLYDTVDFPTLLPMIGEERLRVSFTRQDERIRENGEGDLRDPITLDLAIYKISGRSPEITNRKGQMYTLHATSDEILQSLKTKVRLGLKDMPYSDMVTRVYNDYVKVTKPIEVEATQHLQTFCIPNMPPFRFITHVASRSISSSYGGCAYFFFEDRDKYYYKSLGSLFNQDPVMKFNFAVKNILKEARGERNFDRDLYTAEHLEHSGFDIIKTILAGGYAQKAIFFDPIRRIITTKEWDIDAEWESLPHIDKSKPYTEGNKVKGYPDSRTTLHITNAEHDTIEHIASKQPGINPSRSEEYYLRVSSQLELMMRHSISIAIPGTPQIQAGKVVEFLLPENLGKVSKEHPEEFDAYLQGKYLVMSVTHKLSPTDYACHVTLIKDSFFSQIKHRNPEEEYPIGQYY